MSASAFTIFGWSFSDLFGSSLNRGLVGHWTFDGKDMISNVADASGNGNNGSLINIPATTTIQGVLGQALQFNGTEAGNREYVRAPDHTSLTCPNAVTLSAWVRTSALPSASNYYPIIKKRVLASNSYQLLIAPSGNPAINVDTATDSGIEGTTSVVDGTWHHIAGTWNGTTLIIFTDGAQENQVGRGGTMTDTTDSLGLGWTDNQDTGSFDPYFGLLDDVRVYCRALSSEEIKRLHKMGAKGAKAGAAPPGGTLASGGNSGLVGHWTFDGKNLISNVTDSSGQGNTGRLILGATGNTATTTGMGVLGQAMRFDGVNDYISVPGLTWTPTTFSVSWWVNPSTCTNYNQAIMAANGWGRFAAHTTTLCEMYVGIDQSSAAQRFTSTDLPAGTFTLNTWQLFTFTFDNGDAAIYKNGVLLASKTGMPNPSAWTGFSIGQNNTGTINGLVDDVRIYNRSLSAEEVKRLYSAGAAGLKAGTTPSGGTLSTNGGLVAHWTFDGKHMISNVADASGNGNNGALLLGATGNIATTTTFGKIGQALLFDGVNDYVDLGSSSIYSPERITVSAWVNRNTLNARVVSKDNSARDYELKITSSDTVEFTVWNQAGSAATVNSGSVIGSGWHHIAGTWDGLKVRTYLDGVNQASADLAGSSVHSGSELYIGTRGTNEFFNGALDDVRVYNRALSAEEIKRLYTAGQ